VKVLSTPADGAVRNRQILVAGGLLAAVLVVGFLGAVLYEQRKPEATPTVGAAKTVPLTTPGAALDPRDAWRGKEGAAIEEIKKQVTQLTDDMRKLRQEREQQQLTEKAREREAQLAALTAPAPSAKAPAREPVAPPAAVPAFPPPVPRGAPQAGAMPPGKPQIPGAIQPPTPGIFKLAIADGSASGTPARASASTPPGDQATRTGAAASSARTRDTYLPSTAFMRAVLLSGLDAPTGGQAQNNPHPVLLRVLDHAQLPNSFRSDVKDCFILGSGYGDLSSERAYVRTESLSCIREGGEALDIPLKGVLVGPDGKAGVRGRLVTKTGQVLANALVAGLISGLGTALTSSAITQSVSPLGATQTIDPDKALQAGIGAGLARGLDKLVQYYIALADKIYPVIEVDAGQVVDVVVTRGVSVATGATPEPAGGRDEPAGGREYFASTRRR
jgi:conjugal transfer pilus assembly protein TraB